MNEAIPNTPAASRASARPFCFERMLWASILVVDAFVLMLVAGIVLQNRQRAIDEAAAVGANYARILDEALVGYFGRIDVTLLTVTEEVSRQLAAGGIKERELNAFLARQDKHIPDARGLRVMDVAGNIRYAVNGVAVRGANIGDRPYFKQVRDDPQTGLVFSEPLMGRASKVPLVTLSRRIDDAGGSFAGEVNVAVGIDQIIAKLALLDLGPRGSDSLWSGTQLIARYSKADPDGAKTGTPLPSPELRELIASGAKTGNYRIVAPLDDVARLFSFRRVGDYPLYAVVGLADADYLAAWRANSLRLGGLTALFVAGTLLFGVLVRQLWRRQALTQTALQVEETRYRALFENANDGIFIQDATGFVDCNRRGAEMYGLTREQILGRSPTELCPERQPDGRLSTELAAERVAAAMQGVPQQFEWQPLRADGSPFDVEITLSRMDLAGKPCLQAIMRDIARRKRADEEIRQLNQDLERRVAERTLQLNQAKDTAEAASRAKSVFLANMSHELRTPLGGIIGMAHLALRKSSEPQLRHQLDAIKESAEHLLGLIDDILDITRIDAGTLPLAQSRFAFGEVVAGIVGEIERKAGAKGLQLNIDLPPDLAARPLIGDPARVGQILLDIAGNAVKFTDRGSINLSAGIVEETPSEMLVRWQVRDTGIGIPGDNVNHLFAAFEQLDASMARKHGGAGLGLAICKRLVAMMGGDIGVESIPGQGSTFWFTLRLTKAAE
jgi:PAS domain S-box-containing protein